MRTTATSAIAETMGLLWQRTKERTESLRTKLQSLEARLAELEARGNLADAHKGTYQAGNSYKRGDLLTHGGGLWLCMSDTQGKPGTGASWRLIVKRGAVE